MYVSRLCSVTPSPPAPTTLPSLMKPTNQNVEHMVIDPRIISTQSLMKLLLLIFLFILSVCYLLTFTLECFCFVPYCIPLNIFSRKKHNPHMTTYNVLYHLLLLSLTILASPKSHDILITILAASCDLPSVDALWISRSIRKYSFDISSIAFFASSYSPVGHICCIFILSLSFGLRSKKIPSWFLILILLLSNDIELNPGPSAGNCLTFMNWNLNSLGKDNFSRIQTIEAHNSLHNYDIISLCETSLTDETSSQVPVMTGYTYVPANHPDNVSRGGVGLFYKDTLPVSVRRDLSFNESIVLELKFPRKKIFFTVLYRSPSSNSKSTAFSDFIENLKNLHTSISAENPYAMFFTGDFNAHSRLWWPAGDTTPEGHEIEEFFSSINLSQIINEPTNFTPNKKPTCIDLIFTDQPNLVLNSGTRPSLDTKCHHDIIHCKINYKIPPPPPHERTIWHYDRANCDAIQRSLKMFPWVQHFNLNNDINWQIKSFTEIVHNVISNFVPHDV